MKTHLVRYSDGINLQPKAASIRQANHPFVHHYGITPSQYILSILAPGALVYDYILLHYITTTIIDFLPTATRYWLFILSALLHDARNRALWIGPF